MTSIEEGQYVEECENPTIIGLLERLRGLKIQKKALRAEASSIDRRINQFENQIEGLMDELKFRKLVTV